MKKSIKICIIFLIFMFLIINSVYAENEACKVTLSTDKQTALNIGDEVEMAVTLSNITLTNGITGIVAQLQYDQNIFDIVYDTNSSAADDVSLADLGDSDLKILYYEEGEWFLAGKEVSNSNGAAIIGQGTGDPINSTKTIGKIKLKVKDNVSTTTTTVKLTDITVVGADETQNEISTEASANVTINVVTSKINSDNNITNKNASQQNTTANTSTPYTGVEEVTPIIIAVAIISIVAFIKLVKYKDIK